MDSDGRDLFVGVPAVDRLLVAGRLQREIDFVFRTFVLVGALGGLLLMLFGARFGVLVLLAKLVEGLDGVCLAAVVEVVDLLLVQVDDLAGVSRSAALSVLVISMSESSLRAWLRRIR